MSIPVVAGLFNILAGLMLVAAILLMGSGLVLWVARLGTYPTYRNEAIRIMQWAVAVLFVLIVLMVAVRLAQDYPAVAAVFGIVVAGALIWLGVTTFAQGKSEEDER